MYDDALLASAVPLFAPSNIVTSNTSAATRLANWNAITAAVVGAALAGGGTVALPASTQAIPISAPITPMTGVSIIGQLPILNYATNASTIPDAVNVLSNGGGTVLDCNGGAGFQNNKAVLGVPASPNAFVVAGPTNFAIKSIGFTNFSRAVDLGNTNNPGGWWATFEDLYASGGSDWGFWITNFQHCTFRRNRFFNNATGQGYYGNDVPSAILQPGNSVWDDIYAVCATQLQRCLLFYVIQGQQNEGFLSRIQCNRQTPGTVTQAATMSNTSANIGVTDSTKFLPQMPVTFSAAVNGVTKVTYFILTAAANTVTVSLTMGGAAVVMTGSSAVNIITQGFPGLEVVALAGAAISSHEYHNIDCEGAGTCAILFQNAQTCSTTVSQVPGAAQSFISLCLRGTQFSQHYGATPLNTDFDAASGTSSFFGSRSANSVNLNPQGMYFDQGLNYTVMNLSSSAMSLSDQNLDGTHLIVPLTPIGERLSQKGVVSLTLFMGDSGLITNTYSVGTATWTLPTLSTTVKQCRYRIVNSGTTGQNLVLTPAAGQPFNNVAARTTLTLGTGAGCEIVGTNDASGSYWAVSAIAGTYSAGTITGL